MNPNPNTLLEISNSLFLMNKVEDSLNVLENLLSKNSDFSPAYALRARIYYDRGDYKKAMESI